MFPFFVRSIVCPCAGKLRLKLGYVSRCACVQPAAVCYTRLTVSARMLNRLLEGCLFVFIALAAFGNRAYYSDSIASEETRIPQSRAVGHVGINHLENPICSLNAGAKVTPRPSPAFPTTTKPNVDSAAVPKFFTAPLCVAKFGARRLYNRLRSLAPCSGIPQNWVG